MTELNNKDIVAAVRSNPEVGMRALLARYKEPIYWHIRRLVVSHDDAQDATQETFIRAYRSIGSLKDNGLLNAWIYKIATNEALRIVGRRKLEMLSIEEENRELFTKAADSYVDYSDLEAVKLQKAIHSLPVKQQLAFNLRYYDEMDYDEIARVTESTPKSAKANYHTAKEKIVKFMNEND